MSPPLYSPYGLAVPEQRGVDLKDIVYLMGDEIADDPVKPAAGRKRQSRPGEQVPGGGQVQQPKR
jgi:hypothetical protein